MNPPAKLYIHAVLGLGGASVAASLLSLRVADPTLFAILATLAVIGGALKTRVPGVDGNLSLSFLPMMLAGVVLSAPETILLTVAATLAQATAGVKKRKALQIAFNCAALALSIALGCAAGQAAAGQDAPLVQLALVGGVFYVANTVAVTTVIGLVGGKPFREIWNECFRLYLPYFASGLACALLALTGSAANGPLYPGLAVLPLMLLARHYLKTFMPAGANQRA